MSKYLIRRLLQSIPLLFFISLVLFTLMQLTGDPIATLGGRTPPRPEDRERLRRQLGLDQPILMQYVYWLIGNDWECRDRDSNPETECTYGERLGVLRGDFGDSLMTRRPVVDTIADVLPRTLLLMVSAEVMIIALSLVVGVIASLKQYTFTDNLITTLSFITFSIPIPMMAILVLFTLGVTFKQWHDNWGFPIYFPATPTTQFLTNPTPLLTIWHMVMPVLTIALISIAGYSRYIRSIMLEVLSSDYIRTARAKGLHNNRVLYLHALKNASLPLVTLIGLDLPLLLAGAIVTEQVFSWPGMGRLFITHLSRSDFPVLMALLMLVSIAVVVFQLLTDIAYTVLDPRIRYS
jgi:peptide/nickel transport system permease protein